MIVKLIDFLRDRLQLVIRLSFVGLALLVAWDVLFVSKEHAHTAVEHIPGFWAVFGFAACVVIIIVSKWYGHLGIMTREDYYDN
jgi:hypothetical protein